MVQLTQLGQLIGRLKVAEEGASLTGLREAVDRQADEVAGTFSRTDDAVFILDAEVPPRIVECNEGASVMFGYERGEMVGRDASLLHISRDSMQEFQVLIHAALSGSRGCYRLPEFEMRRKDGSVFRGEHFIGQLVDEGGGRMGWVRVVRDVSGMRGEAELRVLAASRDAVTGLPNRVLFSDRLRVALERAQRKRDRVAVMRLELDCLPAANYREALMLEDVFAVDVCERLKGVLRRSDTLARVEGSSFAILLEDIDRVDGAGEVAKRVFSALSEPSSVEGHDLQLRVSIGIAIYPDDSEDAEGLVRRAHVAMFRAQQEGGDSYQHYALVNWN